VTAAILGLAAILDEVGEMVAPPEGSEVPPGSASEILGALLQKTGFIEALRSSRDPQDEARAENVEELVSVTKEFQKNNPEGTLLDFLTEVSLVAAADDIDDSSGTVSLMTLHTAKGLEYDAVFLTGIEEDLLPHRMSAGEPGGPAEERRLFYVGITRARTRLYLSLAMTRAQFGDVSVAMPSRYLQEIPPELIEWRQSPGMATSRGGTQPRALNARRDGDSRQRFSVSGSVSEMSGGSMSGGLPPAPRQKTEWANKVTATVRDNGDLTLAVGDRIRHVDFGEGRVTAVPGIGPKSIADVAFDTAGRKRLLIKIAPIEKL
jgi:DNA helicase II / ATP-dependent DNA helicase PcrA